MSSYFPNGIYLNRIKKIYRSCPYIFCCWKLELLTINLILRKLLSATNINLLFSCLIWVFWLIYLSWTFKGKSNNLELSLSYLLLFCVWLHVPNFQMSMGVLASCLPTLGNFIHPPFNMSGHFLGSMSAKRVPPKVFGGWNPNIFVT